jgi:hypothetical protein
MLRYIYVLIRILHCYDSLEASQNGGVSPTENPEIHSDVQAPARTRVVDLFSLL